MTEREKFEKWLNTLDKQTLVTMAAKQARTIEKLQAAMKAALPEGWKLVPIEPTHEMFRAGYNELEQSESIDKIYKAMLEAAPDGDK